MAIKTINDNPSISDTIILTFKTPDANNCFIANPFQVNKVVIYYVERDFSSGNLSEYDEKTYDLTKLKAAETAEAIACADPTVDNINNAKNLRAEAESNVSINPFYFNEAKPVYFIGNDTYPAWISTDLENSFLDLVTEDANGNPVYGQFTYTWQPEGMREGDYFACWTWTPLNSGETISDNFKFSLIGDTQTTTSIPTHYTDPLKYSTLLDRYLPDMFKMYICDSDRTPDVLEKFNQAVALGFNTLEDLTNQMVDLQDSNSIHEALIPYLSNLFGLKLKTNDPTKWRGQIKRAVPLFKMKGTKKGIAEAMNHAGIKLLKLTQLWQVISSYTWQEVFTYDGISDFTLEKVALSIDYDNFELWLRPPNQDWVQLNSDYIEFLTADGVTIMRWIGNTLSVNPIDLIEEDEIRVLYLYQAIPDDPHQTIENYVRSLPLMDQRDERNQKFPPKNWNVRVIAPDDVLFNLIVANRHPFCDPLIYGKIRTEFPYGENIFNMDSYNGSVRNSTSPCDIGKEFIDPCTACISSCYNIDLEIENLSDDRISEATEVLTENAPFHAVLHTFNFTGSINEFVESPVEEIEMLITYTGNEFVVSGEAQMYFNRSMLLIETEGIKRTDLATSFIALPTTSGVIYNNNVSMFCPDQYLDDLGVALDGSAFIDIKAPSALAGEYFVNNPYKNTIVIESGSLEPIDDCNTVFAVDDTLNTCAFTFDLNNVVFGLNGTLCNIEQDNIYTLLDGTQDFGSLGVQSTSDVNAGTATYAWKVLISAYSATPYIINEILPNGGLILENTGTLPAGNVSVSYVLYNNITPVISSNGNLTVENRAKVTALNAGSLPVGNIIYDKTNLYQKISGTEYLVIGFTNPDQYYLSGYNSGDSNGVTIEMLQKLVKNKIGYLSHNGLMLKMVGNLEQSLGIQNGVNSLVVIDDGIENDGFKENFIIVINGENYWISQIDGNNPVGYTTITLSGPDHYWKTLDVGGTTVNVTIYQYLKQGATINGQQFDLPPYTFRTLDRSGHEIITGIPDDGSSVINLSIPESEANTFTESVYQEEGISFKIEYDDGTIEQGTL